MEIAFSKVRVVQSLVDESFNPDLLKNYRLFIQLGNDFLTGCVLDDARKKFICLEDFRFSFAGNAEMLAEKCEIAKQQSKFMLLDGFRSVSCCVNFEKSTLVPEALSDKSSEKLFLDFNFGESNEEIILIDDIKLIQAKNMFALPVLIQKMLQYWFFEIEIHHHSTAFIKGLFSTIKKETTVTINLRKEDFDIGVTEGGKLIFYNRFQFKTSEDFLYFILFSLEQLQINAETVLLKLSGEVDKQSVFYKGICKYFGNVFLNERPNPFKYSYKIEVLPESNYTTLFNQFLCES